MKTKINQQNAQINSGLIYYWSITPTCFGPLSRSHHQGVRNPWELQSHLYWSVRMLLCIYVRVV